MPPTTARLAGTAGPVLLAVVVAAVLVGSALLVYRTVGRAREVAARGLGAGFAAAGAEHWRGLDEPYTDDDAQAFLDAHRDAGLRHVAVVEPGGAVLASAGAAAAGPITPGEWETAGERLRIARPLPRRRDRSGPPDEGARRRRLVAIYEFEPVVAHQLRADARLVLGVAAGASVVVITLAVMIVRGARQRERLAADLERGRRLAALGEMSAVLAHELRNPLASLKGHAQLLVETAPADGPVRKKADRVVTEAVRLESLTNDLLEFVRGGELRRAATDPAALVGSAADEVAPGRFAIDAAPDVGPWSLDPARLRQALTNVLRNAVQASPADRAVEVRVARDGRRLAIVVRDHGPGIPAGEERAIFEPFHTRSVRGVGLGLAIARRIVEMHGGTIVAGNHAGGGAEVTIEIPEVA